MKKEKFNPNYNYDAINKSKEKMRDKIQDTGIQRTQSLELRIKPQQQLTC